MKVVVSSKTLANALSELDLENELVYNVVLENNILSINTDSKTVKVGVGTVVFSAAVPNQSDVKWDWVKRLVCAVEEQPITLHIFPTGINVLFQY